MKLTQLPNRVFCYDQGIEHAVCTGCQALQRRVTELQAEVDRFRRQLEEAIRAGKRQAAPFAKGPPKPNPKEAGPQARPRLRHKDLPPATQAWPRSQHRDLEDRGL
jgi:transposase